MEHVLNESARDAGKQFWVYIADVDDDQSSTLYISNGGTRPPNPTVGDFAYEFSSCTVQVYGSDGWTSVTVADDESPVWHPGGRCSIVAFTRRGLAYWKPVGSIETMTRGYRFGTAEEVLSRFRDTFDASDVEVTIVSPASTLTADDEHEYEEMEVDDADEVNISDRILILI